MRQISTTSDLPNVPAVYAMYGGSGRSLHVAYVGVAGKLKNRIEQHLIRRSSSVTTGISAAMLNPDQVTEVHWWEHEAFEDRSILEAAELVAFDVLNPALRSRGAVSVKALERYDEENIQEEMKMLFKSNPTGRLLILTLQDALDRIDALEKRVATLEKEITETKDQR